LTDTPALAQPRKPVAVRQTQAERRRRSEGRIINAALEVIAARGVSRMTLAEVGERAGYSRGLAAHLFGAKVHLLRECVRRMNDDHWMTGLPPAGPESGLAELRTSVRRWFRELEGKTSFSRAYYALIQEANCEASDDYWPELGVVVREMILGGQQRYADYLRAAVARGEAAAGLDPDMEALILHAAIRGVGLQWLIRPESIDLARVRDAMLAKIDGLARG
jgi:AcrR family transcriptional regulator